MRSLSRFAAGLAISLAATTVAVSLAEAQERRPLRITVQKRSYFDAGNVVAVGSMNRYATQNIIASPVYSAAGDLYGEGTLPPRIGAGRNPFANSFSTPGF
ncbi:hypothetical protein [Bosea sp. (in: a-proteobacteria)]|jgi:hypothetical protein|uniref:hypothetical protein n=1 Tax=Bosea sp. (in: a-proteobacteria) TaxID=1871050 RepID=UPI001AC3076A|nr:hypothetical protein [Bosea sp. (in: a-proteobacteria)]MBN9437957.1 hypothetical protein [Bosea sp. (in: a-proteobacteria)]MBN9448968.1 hypothetical protein [Bosea sp. (in: a-proteobacteria)]